MSRDARKSLVIWQTVSNWTSYTRPLEGSTIKEPARARCTLWIGFWFATLARPTTQMAPEGKSDIYPPAPLARWEAERIICLNYNKKDRSCQQKLCKKQNPVPVLLSFFTNQTEQESAGPTFGAAGNGGCEPSSWSTHPSDRQSAPADPGRNTAAGWTG